MTHELFAEPTQPGTLNRKRLAVLMVLYDRVERTPEQVVEEVNELELVGMSEEEFMRWGQARVAHYKDAPTMQEEET